MLHGLKAEDSLFSLSLSPFFNALLVLFLFFPSYESFRKTIKMKVLPHPPVLCNVLPGAALRLDPVSYYHSGR